MKNEKLLLEGAVAGHMNHVYDNGEMTFGELKQLLIAASEGKLRGTEKTDGQNIFLSFNVVTGRAVAIRNKTMIKAGGLNSDAMDQWYSDHPNQSIRYSFVEAIQAFEEFVSNLSSDTQIKIFGEGVKVRKLESPKDPNKAGWGDSNPKADFTNVEARGTLIYYNCEVMNPGNPDAEEGDPSGLGTTNVIPYDKKTLLVHDVGHVALDAESANQVDIDTSRSFDVLQNSLIGHNHDDPVIFSVETHPKRKLDKRGLQNAKDMISGVLDGINNLMQDAGVSDSNTINDFVINQLGPAIDNFGLTEDRSEAILRKAMNFCLRADGAPGYVACNAKDKAGNKLAAPNPNIRELLKGLPVDIASEVRSFIDTFNYSSYTSNLQLLLHDFSNAVLEGFHSSFIKDNEAQIKFLQDEIKRSIEKINNSSNEAAKEGLKKQLEKLKDIKYINTPSEGFVFDFNGVTYKFTGAFAPLNQILGIERYGRYGPLEPSAPEAENDGVWGDKPLRIGIAPGAYKPPHRGHLSMIEKLANGSAEGEACDKIIVIISKPQIQGRNLPLSNKPVTADQAEQIWKAYVDNSPHKSKFIILQSPAASPVGATYDFVMQPADPTNRLVAPPNATVVFGCGDKEDDSSRMSAFRNKSRKDITIDTLVCPLDQKHSDRYMQILDEHPAIAENMPSNKKSTVDSRDLHASDMRYVIDVAAQDSIGLELLKDFVPTGSPEDALAVMGILGLNPADSVSQEEDQIIEPELDADNLNEVVRFYFEESFRKQTAPKGKPSQDPYQINMRKRLSKAHATYLDMGRHDLTKHGGGFHLPRPKNISNAFLAEDIEDDEENLEEAVGVAAIEGAGNAFAPAPVKTTRKKKKKKSCHEENKEQNNMKNEQKLRNFIKKGLKAFFVSKQKEHEKNISDILQEHDLRLHLRNIILEAAAEDPTVDIHDNTGINTLKDLLKNTNVLSTLREVFKTLTTDEDQRNSFRSHIIKWIQDTLAPIRINDEAPLNEQVDIDVKMEDEDKFIEAEDGSPKAEQEKDEDNPMNPIVGADTTGRNKAERIYPTIEKSIIDYYGELDNPEDQELFYDYLIANIKLYFDKWQSEMAPNVEEPSNEEYESAKQGMDPATDMGETEADAAALA